MNTMTGMTLVFMPNIPFRQLNRIETMGSPRQPSVEQLDEPASGGEEDHDFDDERGCLPDVLTKAHSKLPPKVLARSLSKDHHAIEKILAWDQVIPSHCVHRLTLTQAQGNTTDTVRALVLYPLSEDDQIGLEQTCTMQSGIFTTTNSDDHNPKITSMRITINPKVPTQQNI